MIISDNSKITASTAVALGFFDGVHKGHASIISKAKSLATDGIKSLIYTFDVHPSLFFGNPTPMIAPGDSRFKLLESYNVDFIYLQKVNKDFLNISPEDFVDEILINKLGATHVVSGENYTFGKNKSGNSKLLENLCKERGITYHIVPYLTDGDNIISSTLIRQSLDTGDIISANRMLGRPYSVSGKVIHCREVGSTLGFPTANILPAENAKLPMEGVYATTTTIDGKSYPSITNVGSAPTFNEEKVIIETHILDFNKDIYSKNIMVEFIDLIRKQQKFSSPDELIIQLKKDTKLRRELCKV